MREARVPAGQHRKRRTLRSAQRGTECVRQTLPLRFPLLIVTRMGRDYRPGPRQRIEQVARRAAHIDCNIDQTPSNYDRNGELRWTEFSDKNVFEMYVANDMKPGFWLRRTTWGNTCARVIEVGEFKGPSPYFGNPKVYADIFDLRTGALKEAKARIPVPGTYKTWRLIDAPEWWSASSN